MHSRSSASSAKPPSIRGVQNHMRCWGLIALGVLSSIGSGQALTDADRFGKTVDQVLKMGREGWTTFYCSAERGGPGGREQAEVAYCLALNERNERVASTRTPQERLYYDNARSLFADMAKRSFLVGMALNPRWEGWSLEIKRSSTAVNQAVWDLINPTTPSKSRSFAEVRAYWKRTQPDWAKFAGSDINHAKSCFQSLGDMIDLMEDRYRERPRNERLAIINFAIDMVDMAVKKR